MSDPRPPFDPGALGPPPGYPPPGYPPTGYAPSGYPPGFVPGTYASTGGSPAAGPKSSVWGLDRAMAEIDQAGVPPWPARVMTWPLGSVVASIALIYVVSRVWHPHGSGALAAGATLTFALYGFTVAAILAAGRPIAARVGGWAAAFGWDWPRWRDAIWVLPALAGEFIARAIALTLLLIAVPAWRHVSFSNVDLSHTSGPRIALVLVLVVLVAPPIEELTFRGLLLRAGMRRWGFWPAAIASSLVFGALHSYQIKTLAGALLLGITIAVFGLGQCLLVRWTGRLNPAIAVHMITNGLAAVLSIFVLHK